MLISKTNKYQLTEKCNSYTMLQSYVQILQLQTSPDQFLMFLIKAKTVLLLLITSGVRFQSVLPLKDIEFMPKDAVNAIGSARMSLILKL